MWISNINEYNYNIIMKVIRSVRKCIPFIILISSFSKMYKHKSEWQKRKERAVREENRDPTKRALKC